MRASASTSKHAMTLSALTALCSFAVSNCAPPTQTQLVIRVDAPGIQQSVRQLRIFVRREGNPMPFVDRVVDEPRFPVEFGILPANSTDTRRVEIEVRSAPRDIGMLIQRATVRFVANRVMYADIGLSAACTTTRDEECRAMQGMACRGTGECLPAEVPMGEIYPDGGRSMMMRMDLMMRPDSGMPQDVPNVDVPTSDVPTLDAPMSVEDVTDASVVDATESDS